jgi:hypothetical protein
VQRSLLGTATPPEVDQLVVRDPVQPGHRGLPARAEPSPRHDRRRKRLGRQVGRGLGIMRATRGEREQLASVAVIELAESPGWLRAGTLNR